MKTASPQAAPRLHFTDEDRNDPALQKSIQGAEQAADKRDAIKKPTKKKLMREITVNTTTSKAVARLRFEDVPKSRRQPVALSTELHRQVGAHEDDNVGVKAAHETEKLGEHALDTGERVYHALRLKPYRDAAQAERKLNRANLHALHTKAAREHPPATKNPLSSWFQRRAIRKEYAAKRLRGGAYQAGKSAGKAGVSGASKAARFVHKSRGGFLWAALGILLCFILNGVSSCVPLTQTIVQSIVIGTYPATEEDVLAAERAYRAMEQELQAELDQYPSRHPGYDEYQYELQEIWHDPHALIAIISAYHGGEEWTINSAYGTLEKYFKLQYILTETVERQTRYRTETRVGYRDELDPNTGESIRVSYQYEVEVAYTYRICHVKLVNKNLSHLPVYSMSRSGMGLYALYMSTLGNMPDLFRGNPYASELKDPMLYDIPEETLAADAQFAKLIEEAEKYLGYPYVWGGDSPETSFDCSGFISYVFTNSGVYKTGRLGATGLYGVCQKISQQEAKPGDLVFFQGTLGDGVDGNDGITHVGLYVGNGMMIHCGNPISYADLSDSYWQRHSFGYGRIPYERTT